METRAQLHNMNQFNECVCIKNGAWILYGPLRQILNLFDMGIHGKFNWYSTLTLNV